jgi:hypothetical protein
VRELSLHIAAADQNDYFMADEMRDCSLISTAAWKSPLVGQRRFHFFAIESDELHLSVR